MKWVHLILGQWRLVTSALIAGAIIHILVTLSSAQMAQSSAYQTLTQDMPVNQVTFTPPFSATNQPLPYINPDALYSYCRYDASTTPIRVSAKLADLGWSLSLHTPKGENFYFVPGTDRQRTDVELLLVPPGDVFAPASTDLRQPAQRVPTVRLPDVHGLIILRAPIKGLAFQRRVDEMRGAFACRAATNQLAGR